MGTDLTLVRPGESVGTIICVILELAPPSSPSSSVLHMTTKKSALFPFEVIILCPFMTHSSPSLTAVVFRDLGSDPAESGSVIENPDSIS